MDHKKASLLNHKDVAKFLESDLKCGLAHSEAQKRLKRFGRNKLDQHKRPSACGSLMQKLCANPIVQFLRQLLNPLLQLLLICALVSALIGQLENAISVLVAILIVCAIAYVQERRADKSLEALSKQMPSTCEVIRQGQTLELQSELLVPGDLVHLSEGQRVPADIRLFELHSLTINESNLTGETQSQCKQIEPPQLKPLLSEQLDTSTPTASSSSSSGGGGGGNNASQPGALMAIDVGGSELLQEGAELVYRNLALMGTIVESGHSYGLVFATGKWTRYGEVFQLLKSAEHPKSPLQANIDQLSLHLVAIACCLIALTSIVGLVQERNTLDIVYYAISLAVTAIPEGLPVVVAVIMALGLQRLSKQKAIVKSLTSIETLGCTQVLCLDKTGTLTRNDMTLTDIVTSELHSLSSSELEELNQEECIRRMTFNKLGGKMYSIGRVMEVGTLCNNAQVERLFGGRAEPAAGSEGPRVTHPDDDSFGSMQDSSVGAGGATNSSDNGSAGSGGSPNSGGADSSSSERTGGAYRLIGQATDCAILDAALRLGFGDSRTKFERIHETPFSSTSRRMIVQCRRRDLNSNGPMFYLKGAWEEILADCSHYYECGLVKARNEQMWADYARICTTLGAQGLRVLALASGPSLAELTFVGLIGINNSLREGMIETVAKLTNKFHIQVKMITGDSRPTAIAIGRSLGLLRPLASSSVNTSNNNNNNNNNLSSDDEKHLMSGEQLQRLLNTDLDQTIKAREIASKSIFYRVDPIQKANIVSKLQDLDQVVGMTGDGVNDIVSLKRANLSLAMGSGADVCKEIADVVLLDDDLSILLQAVIEGKAIYHKIHNFLAYQISISLSLVLLVAISFGAQTAAPFSVSQLLFINILADGPPAQALAMEQLSENELSLWPRNVHDPLLNCRLLATLLILSSALLALNGALYDFLLDAGGELSAHARSLQFAAFVFSTLFASISLRSKFKTVLESRFHGNKQLLACCTLLLLLQLALTEVKPLAAFFQMEPVPFVELVYVFLYASIVLIIMDGAKLCFRFLEYGRSLLLKAAHSFQMPSYSRQQSYSTSAISAKSSRFASNADYLNALRPQETHCVAVTPLAAPRTLFGNIMPTPKINITKAASAGEEKSAGQVEEKEDGKFDRLTTKSVRK